ncbi:MAG TPA: hypothetical protein VJT75_07460 [Thermoleophilaceae bacterium]|nr:hypothetical protein [Thermoleophilaceae bacterium]
MYKAVIKYPDGTRQECDDVFETEEDARQDGLVYCESYEDGGEVLHMSNPGDYPAPNEDDPGPEVEVIEVEA